MKALFSASGAVLVAIGGLFGNVDSLVGQVTVGPEVAWSDSRGGGVGARADWHFWENVHLIGQGLFFFPDESGLADPGVGVDRKSWQLNANVVYDIDRRSIYAYAGGGASYSRGSLSLTVDGLEASAVNPSWAANLLVGLKRPVGGWRPFVEGKVEVFRDGEWVIASGVTFPIGAEW